MTNYVIDIDCYTSDFVDALEKIFTRMGWMPERKDEEILVTIPTEDAYLFDVLYNGGWF